MCLLHLCTSAARGQCVMRTQGFYGTSMSAAVTSGNAALARQYFRAGYYPAGDNTSALATPFAPSGMLLKAVLIGGAVDLSTAGGRFLFTGQRLSAAPDRFQGWGRLSLARSTPLARAAATAPATGALCGAAIRRGPCMSGQHSAVRTKGMRAVPPLSRTSTLHPARKASRHAASGSPSPASPHLLGCRHLCSASPT